MKLQINGEERELAEGLTLAALLEQLGMKADRVAVELNRDIVRRERWAQTHLREGDSLEIVQFVGGGLPKDQRRGRRDDSLLPVGLRAED
ncbi:MAG TPA: sulfur carrier protein ThiS [Terriglobales bacterium]|nr:sulfur carrier protein ThiS [Terriglobales bacterium]